MLETIDSIAKYVQVIWLGIGMMFTYAARANLSVAIVSMTDVNITFSGDTIYLTTAQKGSLLAAFFYSYVTCGVLYGFIAYHLSPRIVLGASGIICGLATLAFPYVSIHLGYTMSFMCRVILGLCEGPFYPCIAALISNWAPRNERSRINSFICSGAALGQALMMASSGALSASTAGSNGISTERIDVGLEIIVFNRMTVLSLTSGRDSSVPGTKHLFARKLRVTGETWVRATRSS